jgi:hypothetical protein
MDQRQRKACGECSLPSRHVFIEMKGLVCL